MKTKRVPLTANNLTADIIARIQYDGWDAWRINTTGILDPSTGRYRKVKESEKGKSDVWGVAAGLALCIEVKVGKDRQSDEQKAFQKRVESAGGTYIIAKDQIGFLKDYQEFKEKHGLVGDTDIEQGSNQ